jgi:hypothetical protein
MAYAKDEIKARLDDLKTSLQRDVGLALEAYISAFQATGLGVGFYGISRMIFPEIDTCGSYYAGEISNTPGNSIKFMRRYFPQVNPRYKDCCGFIYLTYRHGLTHQHVPKNISYKRRSLGWAISLDGGHLTKVNQTIILDGKQFYEDFLAVIDLFRSDLDEKRLSARLVNNFNAADAEMKKPISKGKALNRWRYLSESDFKFLKW